MPSGRILLLGAIAVAVPVLLLAIAAIARAVQPFANTEQHRFDTILVLGKPADRNGNPTPEQIVRVTEAVHEYERGVAPRIIFSGGAAHNEFVEARVMADVARSQGIPPSAMIEETQAISTVTNLCYSMRIMQAHGWHSVEVIGSPLHLPRAALMIRSYPVAWSMHTSPEAYPNAGFDGIEYGVELLKTVDYLFYTRYRTAC